MSELDDSIARHPAVAEPRQHLLGDLALINEALARNHALPDVTVAEAAGMTFDDLAAAIAGSSRRLAQLIAVQ